MKNLGLFLVLGLALSFCILALNGAQSSTQQMDKEPEVVSLLGKKLYAAPAEGEELAKLQGTLEEAARALETSPDNLEAIIVYGRALAGMWRYHDDIEVYSKGIKVHPDEAMLYRHRGHRYISIRKFGKAASDMAKAAALNA